MAIQSRAPTILLTRPLLQSQRFAAELCARWPEIPVEIAPLMAPEYRLPALPAQDFAALILTSETGAEAARRISAAGIALPARAYCVGDRTAAAARSAGFLAISAGGDADDLLVLIQAEMPRSALLFLRGVDSVGNIDDCLNSAGIETVSAIAYVQTPQAFTVQAARLLQQTAPVIVPLFSPRSARIFIAEWPHSPSPAPLWIAALSPAVAEVAVGLGPDRMATAAHPDAGSMLIAVAALLGGGMGS
jgi:uroporphyrinogen-III synthase